MDFMPRLDIDTTLACNMNEFKSILIRFGQNCTEISILVASCNPMKWRHCWHNTITSFSFLIKHIYVSDFVYMSNICCVQLCAVWWRFYFRKKNTNSIITYTIDRYLLIFLRIQEYSAFYNICAYRHWILITKFARCWQSHICFVHMDLLSLN